jgi:hypothetical protein
MFGVRARHVQLCRQARCPARKRPEVTSTANPEDVGEDRRSQTGKLRQLSRTNARTPMFCRPTEFIMPAAVSRGEEEDFRAARGSALHNEPADPVPIDEPVHFDSVKEFQKRRSPASAARSRTR